MRPDHRSLRGLTAVASLVDGTIERVDFDQDLALTPSFDTGVALDVTIRSVLLRLTFDPSMTNVLWAPTSTTSSMLGGSDRREDIPPRLDTLHFFPVPRKHVSDSDAAERHASWTRATEHEPRLDDGSSRTLAPSIARAYTTEHL